MTSLKVSASSFPLPPYVRAEPKSPLRRLRMLISYPYLIEGNTPDLQACLAAAFTPPGPLLFIDCGAFTAHKKGTQVPFAPYGSYLLRHESQVQVMANLDVIGQPQQTWTHQQALEAWGLQPLPVFHYGAPWRFLDRYLEQYSYVALGGLVGKSANLLLPWLETCFTRAQRTGTEFHGFGVSSPVLLRAFPFYSSDSSTWDNGPRYGDVSLWNGERILSINVGRRIDAAAMRPHRELLASYGLPVTFLEQKTKHQRRLLRRRVAGLGMLSMLRVAEEMRRLHGPRILSGMSDPEGPGYHFYFATSRMSNTWVALLQLVLSQNPYTRCLDPEWQAELDREGGRHVDDL